MKKLLSLLMAVLMLVTVIGAVPTVFAEESEYIPIDENYGKMYWEELYESYSQLNIVKSGDWYYAFWKSIWIDGELIAVCGYNGNETEITIPTELDGKKISLIEEFYLMTNSVKTIIIPKEITSIDGFSEYRDSSMWDRPKEPGKVYTPVFEGESQLENIIVDSENENYISKDGVLFTKNGVRLVYYPTHKADENYVVPSTVEYITRGVFAGAENLKSLTITPNVTELGYDSIPKKGLDELRFENTQLPEYGYNSADPEEDEIANPKYVPDVPNTVVYCIEGSKLYEEYKHSFEEPDAMCKELKALPPFTETLKKDTDGKWYYYNNDYKVKKSTLVKYKGVWFYVKNGVWDKTVNNIIVSYKGKEFYIKNGKWKSSVNTLVKVNGYWYYIKSGKWDSSIKTLTKYKGKWFYIKNGKWCKDTAIVKYKGKRFYVKSGKIDFSYSGKKKIDGKTYKIKNGKVV